MRTYIKGGVFMNRMAFGMFGLCMLVGNYFGSNLGTAVAVCVFMVASGAIDEMKRRRQYQDVSKKKEDK